MEIGKPRRIHKVEPLKDPVPAKRDPAAPPEEAPAAPKKAPAK